MARRLLAAVVALLALLAGALGAVACSDDGQDAAGVLAATFGEDKDVRSGRIDLSVRVDAPGLADLEGPVGLRLSGPFATSGDGELPRFDLGLRLDGGGRTLDAGAVSTGDRGFLRLRGQAYAVDEELFAQFRAGYAEQARCTDGDGGAGLAALGVDPRRWLRGAEVVGTDEVGGVAATHVRAGVDVPRLLEDVDRVLARAGAAGGRSAGCPAGDAAGGDDGASRLSAAERRRLAESVRDARVEVWSGEDDRIVRRLNVALRLAAPEGEAADRAGTLQLDLLLGAVNEDVEIRAPAGARPLEALTGRLRDALGAG
jgi:hypothetical protein